MLKNLRIERKKLIKLNNTTVNFYLALSNRLKTKTQTINNDVKNVTFTSIFSLVF